MARNAPKTQTTRLQTTRLQTFAPGSPGYAASTSPRNTSADQAPALVLRPRSAEDVARAVTVARSRAARLSVQATGHGAARPLGPETVLLDTAALATVRVQAGTQVARIGAGTTWGPIQREASRYGLLGLAGTSPSVGVAGYTFGGGLGWFTRRHGLASGHLRAVRYVDGEGRIRTAADQAPDPLDREAIWAFRGGAPVGIAVELDLDLIRPGPMWAGHLLWPADVAEDLIGTWARSLPELPETVTSTMAMLRLPPSGPFPSELLGTPAVHLSYAATGDQGPMLRLRDRLLAVAPPAADSTGPADAERLGQIHLDPPSPVAARGGAAWLTGAAGNYAADLLLSARVGHAGGAAMAELRHVDSHAPVLDGALTRPPGPYLFHVVGPGDATSLPATTAAIAHSLQVASSLDTGADPLSFREADPRVTALSPRLAAISAALDPNSTFAFERLPHR